MNLHAIFGNIFLVLVSCSYARKLFSLNKTLVYTCTSISQELSQANAFNIWYKSRIVTVCMWLLVYISRDFVTNYQDFLTMYSNWLLKMLKLLHSIIDSRCDVVNIKYITVDSSAKFKNLAIILWELRTIRKREKKVHVRDFIFLRF